MKRMVISLVLIFFILSSTTVVYAQIKEPNDILLDSISDYYLIDQKLMSGEASKLVPYGVARAENDVYYVVYQYEVVVRKGMDLQVMIEDMMFSQETVSNEQLRSVFTFDIDEQVVEELHFQENLLGESIDAQRIMITIRISMNEPSTYDLYRQLAGGHLTFEVYFFAV